MLRFRPEHGRPKLKLQGIFLMLRQVRQPLPRDLIREALRIASESYDFNEDEKKAALPLYRCLKPLWYTRVWDLKEAGTDPAKIRECLDRIEYYQTADIDFAGWME